MAKSSSLTLTVLVVLAMSTCCCNSLVNAGILDGVLPASNTCPVDLVKLNVCTPLLGGLVAPGCCPLLGLLGVDLEVCLCLAVDLKVLGLVNVNLSKLDVVAKIATSCGYAIPPGFTCPA